VLGILGLFRAGWLTAASYRVRMAVSLLGSVAAIIPLFFVSRAMQPLMQPSISSEGGQYFGFLLIGMTCMTFITLAVIALPNAVSAAINTGTLESLLETPTSVASALAGLVSYEAVLVALRAMILIVAGGLLGAAIMWTRVPLGILIVGLILVAHIPLGLLAAAGVLAFRTAGPLPQGVIVVSGLLGGVYYPTHVIPGWLESVANVIPLSHGLRALRRVLTVDAIAPLVWSDLGALVLIAIPLWAVAAAVFALALRRARQYGQLGRH
jgi:ABC-type multidrug transport system permease subunit